MSFYGTFDGPKTGPARRRTLEGAAALAASLLVAVLVVRQHQQADELLVGGGAGVMLAAPMFQEEAMLQRDLAMKRQLQMQALTGRAGRLAAEQRAFLSRAYPDASLARMQQKWIGSPEKFLPPNGDYPGGSTGIPEDGYLAYETGWGNYGPYHGELAPMQEAGISNASPAESGEKPPARRSAPPAAAPSAPRPSAPRPAGGKNRSKPKPASGGRSAPAKAPAKAPGGAAEPKKMNMSDLGKELGVYLGKLIGGKIGGAIGKKMKKQKPAQKIGEKIGGKLGKAMGNEIGKTLQEKVGRNVEGANFQEVALNLCGMIGGKIGQAIGAAIGAKFVFFKKLGKKLGGQLGEKLGKALGQVMKKEIGAKIAQKFGKGSKRGYADQMQLVQFETMLAADIARIVDRVAEEEMLNAGSSNEADADSNDVDDEYSDDDALEEARFIMKKLMQQEAHDEQADEEYVDAAEYNNYDNEFAATPGDAWGMKQEWPQQLRQRELTRMMGRGGLVPVQMVGRGRYAVQSPM